MGGESRYPLVPVGEILRSDPSNGFSPKEVAEWTGLLSLGLGCLTKSGFLPRQLKRVPDSSYARRFLLSDGDLLLSRANTRELVGLVGIYRDVGNPCIYPDLMMRLIPNDIVCLPSYLELVLGSATVRRELQAGARGTSESMVKISASLVQSLRVPLPSIAEQRKIVNAHAVVEQRIAALDQVRAKLRVIQRGVVEGLLGGRDYLP
ncbi:hypothetical protein [Streptomyces salinarius]|uniref:Type I restriction modification DNA specificity domain-containing protein n=1 Tax=Streptomyces salinarius TaxID=2762598 RepID=A0ABW8BJZ0_9ACTN